MTIKVRNSRNVSINLLPVMLNWFPWVCEIMIHAHEGGIFDLTFMNLCFPVSEEHTITLRKHNIGKLGAISFCLWCYEYIPFFPVIVCCN